MDIESVGDLLGRYTPKEPNEVLAIKQYITDHFHAESRVGLNGETIVITVGSASLANALRLRLPALQAAAKTTKRIAFRIG